MSDARLLAGVLAGMLSLAGLVLPQASLGQTVPEDCSPCCWDMWDPGWMQRDRWDPSHMGPRQRQRVSLSQLIEELASYLIGWRGYFGFCQTPRVLSNLDASIRRRLRSYLWWQWQNGRKRFKELRRLGVPKFLAAVAAGSPTSFWRMSSHPAVQMALRNHYFDEAGLPRLHIAALA